MAKKKNPLVFLDVSIDGDPFERMIFEVIFSLGKCFWGTGRICLVMVLISYPFSFSSVFSKQITAPIFVGCWVEFIPEDSQEQLI